MSPFQITKKAISTWNKGRTLSEDKTPEVSEEISAADDKRYGRVLRSRGGEQGTRPKKKLHRENREFIGGKQQTKKHECPGCGFLASKYGIVNSVQKCSVSS